MANKSNDDWLARLTALRSQMPDEPQSEEKQEEKESGKPQQTARLDIVLDRKGRSGKTATIIEGFTIADEEVERLAAELKKRLGTGGSSRGGEILIQGDRRTQILDFLKEKGFKARVI